MWNMFPNSSAPLPLDISYWGICCLHRLNQASRNGQAERSTKSMAFRVDTVAMNEMSAWNVILYIKTLAQLFFGFSIFRQKFSFWILVLLKGGTVEMYINLEDISKARLKRISTKFCYSLIPDILQVFPIRAFYLGIRTLWQKKIWPFSTDEPLFLVPKSCASFLRHTPFAPLPSPM